MRSVTGLRLALMVDGLYPREIGGIQKHSLFLSRHLAELGVEVDLYAATSAEPAADRERPSEWEDLRGVRLHTVPRATGVYFPGHYLLRSYATSLRLRRAYLAGPGADFIYAQGFAGWATVRARRQTPALIPTTGVHFHGLEMYQKACSLRSRAEQWLLRPAVRQNLRLADSALTLGSGLTEIIEKRGVPRERIIHSANGIGEEWKCGEPPRVHSPRTFVFIGRYERRKGLPELHKAFRALSGRMDLHLNIVGPVPHSHRLRADNVRYWGEIRSDAEVRGVLGASDVLVLPSHSEGLPTVVLEAMASGLAVIATDVGAVPALVSEKNGWLIRAGDIPSLVNAMREAVTEPEGSLKSMKLRSCAKAEDYRWESVAERTLEGIQSFLDLRK